MQSRYPASADPVPYARRCAQALNSLHSILYFTADLREELAPFGVEEHSSVYMAGRAAPLGAVGSELVTGVFNSFAPGFVASRVPGVWDSVSPERAVEARQKAAGTVLQRLLGRAVVDSRAMADAAELATEAAAAGLLAGRPLHAANAALARPDEPHVALWHAATLLREHRGDGHVAVLDWFEVTGIRSLVIDCASGHGMPKEIVMPMRGWTEEEWSAARDHLAASGLIDGQGRLTAQGAELRDEIEYDTSRLDRQPYEALGGERTEKLARFVHGLVNSAADAGVFPPPLRDFFAPPTEKWNDL
ncbi:SCO6745 family protein [Streptomyces tailanensis]|uniref:SCO6745 family protein n=1 Tax=Streptomyces tailanensis TaxID=2569858 RepID=UPI00122DD27A|nr:hypothetical protein [Streptomyces tailanensis]